MDARRAQLELLAHAGRLLLEYNESAGEIHRALAATARALTGDDCGVAVSYSGLAVTLAGEGPLLMPVRELRYNTAVQTRLHAILRQVRRGELDAAAALVRLHAVEADSPKHPPGVVMVLLGVGAAALAGLLGADAGAVSVAALSTSLGLPVRSWLHRRRFSLLALPLAAAFVGALLGGAAIRFGWTSTPGLVLIVPCLMIVPGPHLINGLLDLVDNHVPMSLARLGLAAGILLAAGLGLLVGVRLTLPDLPEVKLNFGNDQLNLVTDMLLAGLVTCAFAVYYNAAWSLVRLAIVGGMIGHGLRFLALESGWTLEAASFVGGFAVGLVAAWMARSSKTPLAAIAFSGAVTMMPGLQMYSALRGALQLAQRKTDAAADVVTATLANGFQAAAVAGALALGLVVAARAVQMLPHGDTPARGLG
jgi:uncharacterized membrane protein YjjP (DUF1212 family)